MRKLSELRMWRWMPMGQWFSMGQERSTKQLIIFFGSLAVFIAALILGTNFLLRRVTGEKPEILPRPSGKPGEERDSGGAKTRIIAPGRVDPRAISYTEAGFEPATITVQSSDPLSCLITVTNKSGATIRVGVSPHDPAGDPGADYGALAPGQTGIYDVRYTGFDRVTLHRHQHPQHKLTVIYGQGCR